MKLATTANSKIKPAGVCKVKYLNAAVTLLLTSSCMVCSGFRNLCDVAHALGITQQHGTEFSGSAVVWHTVQLSKSEMISNLSIPIQSHVENANIYE